MTIPARPSHKITYFDSEANELTGKFQSQRGLHVLLSLLTLKKKKKVILFFISEGLPKLK